MEMADIANRVMDLFFITDYYAVQQPDGSYRPHRIKGKLQTISESKIIDSIDKRDIVLGTYSTSRDNKCKWLVVDFDIDTGRDDVFRARQIVFDVYKKCLNLKLKPYIESSGNKGYHLWVLYNELDSETAYKAVNHLGAGCKGEKYPLQPKLEQGKQFGNLVRLPCSINRKTGRPSQWLDVNFEPHKDQLGYFMNIERTSTDRIKQVADLFTGEIFFDDPLTNLVITGENVDITHGLFKIDERGRHAVQFQLIMKCLEANMDKGDILNTGIAWLKLYSKDYKSPFQDALIDFKKSLNYIWRRAGK